MSRFSFKQDFSTFAATFPYLLYYIFLQNWHQYYRRWHHKVSIKMPESSPEALVTAKNDLEHQIFQMNVQQPNPS